MTARAARLCRCGATMISRGGRHASALAWTLVLVAGLSACALPAPIGEHWTYVGTDESRRYPPPVPRGDLSAAAWAAKRQQSEAAWWQERELWIEQAKSACVRETGDRGTPDPWWGYSRAFKACMVARGWSEGRSPI